MADDTEQETPVISEAQRLYQEQLLQVQQQMQAAMEQSASAQREAQAIAQEQLTISQRQAELAEERYNYWKENFLPAEQELIAQAKAGIDPEAAGRIAGTRAEAAYAAAGGAANRMLERLGIAPTDERYNTLLDDMQYVQRAATAGAKNLARDRAEEVTQEMRLAVAGMGRGIPVESLRGFTESARTIGMAGDQAAQGSAGVVQAQMTGLQTGMRSAGVLGNYNAAQSQFAAERAFQKSMDQTQNQAMAWELLGNVGGTALGTGISLSANRGTSA